MSGTRVEAEVRCSTDGRTAEMAWREILQPWLADRSPRSVRPELLEYVEQMKLAASMHLAQRMSAIGRVDRTSSDMAAESSHDDPTYTANDLAGRFHCDPRHVRRVADELKLPGLPGKPRRWSRADVVVLETHFAA